MPERAWKALLALLVLVFVARVASTYRVFNDTIDENDDPRLHRLGFLDVARNLT